METSKPGGVGQEKQGPDSEGARRLVECWSRGGPHRQPQQAHYYIVSAIGAGGVDFGTTGGLGCALPPCSLRRGMRWQLVVVLHCSYPETSPYLESGAT
ncbi:hypothetical protein B296_00040294 [Ensete ventricosum]|uniref:Uncharacterized protein n=1 Tax=Ensete ventricosum TaxID=4639 RepID=A0A426ZQW4_ENSVE|nr:hypothetical protein B296_00040294 [Ensete ventricosum]